MALEQQALPWCMGRAPAAHLAVAASCLTACVQSEEEEDDEGEGEEAGRRYERRVRQTVQRYSPPKDEPPHRGRNSKRRGGHGGEEEDDDSDEEVGCEEGQWGRGKLCMFGWPSVGAVRRLRARERACTRCHSCAQPQVHAHAPALAFVAHDTAGGWPARSGQRPLCHAVLCAPAPPGQRGCHAVGRGRCTAATHARTQLCPLLPSKIALAVTRGSWLLSKPPGIGLRASVASPYPATGTLLPGRAVQLPVSLPVPCGSSLAGGILQPGAGRG